jgi:hypothetical protein
MRPSVSPHRFTRKLAAFLADRFPAASVAVISTR